MGFPIFVTRVKVGRGKDVILISAESPAGVSGKNEVESVEALRFVVSLSTFAEITELFVRTLKTVDPALLKALVRPGVAAQLQAGELGNDQGDSASVFQQKH